MKDGVQLSDSRFPQEYEKPSLVSPEAGVGAIWAQCAPGGAFNCPTPHAHPCIGGSSDVPGKMMTPEQLGTGL